MTNWEYYDNLYGNGNIPTEKAPKLFQDNDGMNLCFVCPAKKLCCKSDLLCSQCFEKWATAEVEEKKMDYDTWKLGLSKHRCECGELYYESDGGPCHVRCESCGELVESDEINDDGLCEKCEDKKMREEQYQDKLT